MEKIHNNSHHRFLYRRTSASEPEDSEKTDGLATNLLEKIMLLLDWRLIGSTRAADNIGVDYVYRKKHAEIDIQVKGSRPVSEVSWSWIVREEGKLNMDFYGEAGNFLFLAGFYQNGKEPEQALIQGHRVRKYFENPDRPKTPSIRISAELKNSELFDCFDIDKIEGILNTELEEQEEEYSWLKSRRVQEEQGHLSK